MSELAGLRGDIDAWVAERFPNAVFADGGGQRLVYRDPGPPESALKVWPVADASQHERHVREVSALAALSHPGLPGVVRHLSQVELKGRLLAFYQEAWVPAPKIRQRLRAGERFEPSELSAFLGSCAWTLAALHQRGVIHRDISMNNVMWDGEQAYLIDLGLAKHLELGDLTATSDALPRTVLTASPEQLQGASADLREATDIFSLGVIGWTAGAGRHPFIDEQETIDVGTLVGRQLRGDVRGEVEEHEDILRSMLHAVSFYRPSAEAVVRAVR